MSIAGSARPPENASPPREQRRSPLRGSTLLAVLALAVAAAGALYLRGQSGETVVVSARDLPAFHRIGQADLMEKTVARSSLPASFESDELAIIGRYTTDSVEKSDVIVEDVLGPRLESVNPSELAVTALDATPAQALSGALRAGDLVSLVLSAGPGSTSTVVIRDVVVLNAVQVNDEAHVVTVGLDESQATDFGSTTFVDWRLVREVAYQLP